AYRAGAMVALALLDEASAARAEEEKLRGELSSLAESSRIEKEQLKSQLDAAQAQSKVHLEDAAAQAVKIRDLEVRLAESSKQLEALHADVSDRDEALKK